jgi:hypothetical protein
MKMSRLVGLLVLFAAVEPLQAAAQSGTWSVMTAPFRAQTPLLLTDGSVFVHEFASLNWWRLQPDATGDYVHGTWTKMAPLPADANYNPLYYCSAVLPDGRVVIMGGEYNLENGTYVVRELNTGAIYSPFTNTWASLPGPSGWTRIGDMMCTVMPSTGRLLLARQSSTQLATLDPVTLTWSPFIPAGKTPGDSNSEEGWTLLPDGTLMVVNANSGMASQRFIPNGTGTGQWIDAGAIPVPLRDSSSHETGAQVLMHNGKVFAAGADRNTGSNAVFTPPPFAVPPATDRGSWEAAPPFPRKPYAVAPPSTNCTGTAPDLLCQLDQADGPGVLMPNGRVLVAAAPGVFQPDTYFFEYDPNTNTLPEVARPANARGKIQFQYHMLLLPSGQVFAPDGSTSIQVYTGSGAPDRAWAPAITALPRSLKPGGTYSLSGTQLNGLSEAVSYGDDYAAATNYPIVRITNRATGHVFWARTHDRDTTAIATGSTIITTQLDIAAELELGTSDVAVIANGIASDPVAVNHPPVTTDSLAGKAGRNGWYVGDVTVTLTATDPDGAADIVATRYTIDDGPPITYAGPFTATGDAVHRITFWSEDQAGNRDDPVKSDTIKIDATPPTLVFSNQVPVANRSGWNNTSVAIAYATSDNLSGVASPAPEGALRFGVQGAGQTQSVTVTDEAGNSATFTSPPVNVDFTAPALTVAAETPVLWPPNNKFVAETIVGTLTDAVSGVDPGTLAFAVTDEYGDVQPAGSFQMSADGHYSFTVNLQASRRGADHDGRQYRITVAAADRGGNPVSRSTVVVVPHDRSGR